MLRVATVSQILVYSFLLLAFHRTDVTTGLYVMESESREVKQLSGIWRFRADVSLDRNKGFDDKWYSTSLPKDGNTILMAVPSSFNDITVDRKLRDYIGWVWYQRNFFPPQAWKTNKRRTVLRFESAYYHCIVWVNGKRLMEHIGGHLPFEKDVTSLLKPGELNNITVAVNNTLTPNTVPCGSVSQVEQKNKHLYPEHYFTQDLQFDFFNYAGLHRPVRLYTTPHVYIKDIDINTEISADDVGIVQFRTTIGNLAEKEAQSKALLSYVLLDQKNKPVVSKEGKGLLKGKLTVDKAKLWWPIDMSEEPGYMYTLMITLLVGDMKDVYRLPVGIRTVKVVDTSFLINGRKFYFKGVGMHEDYNVRGKGEDMPSILKDFNLLKWLGVNSFRTSHYPYSEEIMNLADQMGIVVIDEAPAVGLAKKSNFDKATLDLHLGILTELIDRDKNRPAVVLWSVANEPLSNCDKSEKYFKKIFEHTRHLDSTRPVTFVTHMQPYSDKAIRFVDVVCANRYYSWYHDSGHLEVIQSQLEYELRDWHNASKKPVIVTEYGAGAIAGLHMEPPVMFSEEYQVEALREYFPIFDKLRDEFLIGEMVWAFADFMTNQGIKRVAGNRKGLFTRDRQPKAAAHVIRHRYHDDIHQYLGHATPPPVKDTPNPSPAVHRGHS